MLAAALIDRRSFFIESYMVSPTCEMDSASTRSAFTFATQFGVGHSSTCDI